MKKQFQIFIFSFLTIIQISTSVAQGTSVINDYPDFSATEGGVDSPATIFNTLRQANLLKITIDTDLDNLIDNRKKDDYQDAELTIFSKDGPEQHKVRLKPRGKFRRRTCDFPPLKVKFNKSELAERGISTSHKSLKLVTHCMDDEVSQQSVLKEYAAYKMYNEITEASFNIQLVEITYKNSAKNTEEDVKYGFFIEDTGEIVDRIGGGVVEERYNISLDSISKRYSHLIPMFQFMIANMDWRPRMLQNIKVIKKENGERIMIPYDFDFSGLVDASYAVPNIDFKQTDIRQRLYMNKVDNLNELAPTIRFFQLHKAEVIKCISDCQYLTKKNRKNLTKYINAFFTIINSDELATAAFVK
ncbi:MAG: hypothetical protein ACI8P3_001603 [Saprospiraceae bacterium]|jgi:hypothetical protein